MHEAYTYTYTYKQTCIGPTYTHINKCICTFIRTYKHTFRSYAHS